MLRFNDGVNIDTRGKYRILRLKDGYYVVGHGMCIPVDSYEEGKEILYGEFSNKEMHLMLGR